MTMEIRLRFYHERYNMDPAYYTGNEDIAHRHLFVGIDDLKRCWKALLSMYEGDTYSARVGKEIVSGGAFDPGDIDTIEENYNNIMREKMLK